jgi:hypothetical protein
MKPVIRMKSRAEQEACLHPNKIYHKSKKLGRTVMVCQDCGLATETGANAL